MDPDVNKCPTCTSILHLVQGTKWKSSPVVQCLICLAKPYLCGTCLCPWQGPPGVLGHCANKRCAIVGTLLTCELITDPKSPVRGCPQFRACPKCHCLLMHERGCNCVVCLECQHCFCYICVRSYEECAMAVHVSRARCTPAARQRFYMTQ